MKRSVAVAILVLAPVALFAQNGRTFVSTTGNDVNSCIAGSPCRSFSRALSVTNAGGEVVALDSGGFGTFTVTTAVIVAAAPGVRASITSSSSDAVVVSAGTLDNVVLSGLSILLTGSHTGINAFGFHNLSIDHCTVDGGQTGLTDVAGAGSFATVSDSVFRNQSTYGIDSASHGALIHCRIENNFNSGLYVEPGVATDGLMTAVDLVVVNSVFAVYASSQISGHTVIVDLDRAFLSHNSQDGVYADARNGGQTVVRIANSTVTENQAYGLAQFNSATIQSLGNNFVAGNAIGDLSAPVTTIAGH